MSSSDDSAFHDGDESDDSAASNSSSSSEGSFDSAADDNGDNDAIFISSHSQIVISPRRRINASTWKHFEERIGAESLQRSEAQRLAEQLGVDALHSKRNFKSKSAAPMASEQTSDRRKARSSSTTRETRRTTTKTARGTAGDVQYANATLTKRSSSKSTSGARNDASSTGMPALDPNLYSESRRTGRANEKSKAHATHHRQTAVAAASPSGAVGRRRRRRGDRERGVEAQSSSSNDARSASDSERRDQEEEENQQLQQRQYDESGSGDDDESENDSRHDHERALQAKRSGKSSSQVKQPSRQSSDKKQPSGGTTARRKSAPASPAAADAVALPSPSSSSSSSSDSLSPAKRNQKPTSFLSENSGIKGSSFSAAAVLPSPREEMEELKQTLQKLASHDQEDIGDPAVPAFPTAGPPVNGTKSADDIGSCEYLRVATGLTTAPSHHPSANQLRLGEYVSQPFGSNPKALSNSGDLSSKPNSKANGSHHASFDPATLSAKLQHARETSNNSIRTSRSKSLFANANAMNGSSDFQSMSDDPRLSSLNKKLFGQSSNTNPYSSRMNGLGSSMQMQGMAGGMNGAIGAGGAGAQGSRAVLSALKALQDKIRRLEEERETLLQQLSDEKVRARKREAELASSEKKFSYELGQTKESARAAYDAIRSEREELNVELVKAEERKKSLESEIGHFQALVQTYSSKSDDLQTQLEISESQRKRLQDDFEHLQAKYKSETQDLRAKVASLEQQQQASEEQMKLLDAQLQREASNHAETRERLQDSEQSVASISQLNEKLVARVWEVTDVANKTAKQNKKLLQQQRVSTVSKTTAASRASTAAAQQARSGGTGGGAGGSLASRRATGSTVLSGRGGTSEGATRLRKKVSAASGAPSGLKRGAGGGGVKKARQSADGGLANNMELLRDANLGKEIPFLLGTSSNPSFSIIGNVQDAIRQCDTTYVTPNTLTGVGSSNAPIKIPTATTTTATSRSSSSHKAAAIAHGQQRQRTPKATKASKAKSSSGGVSAKILGMDVGCAMPTTLLLDRTAKAERKRKPSAIQVPPPPAPVSAHINPMQVGSLCSLDHQFLDFVNGSNVLYLSLRYLQTQIMDDLGAALQSAEQEFATLSARYKDIVSRMKAEGANSSNSNGGSSSAQLSSALGSLLDELEAKGKQVNLLKQVYQQAANSSINPLRRIVHSPEAIRRKTASLRLLNEYRQLKRDARSSPPPQHQPHQHQRNASFFSDQEQYY